MTVFVEARERLRLGWTVDPTTRRRAPFLASELAAVRADRRVLERVRRDFENAAAATYSPASCQ